KEVMLARDWLRSRLDASGVRYHLDGGNYVLIWPRRQSSEVEAALRAAGILVREMSAKPLIDGSLRVSIGTTRQMQQFWQAFAIVESLAA
ncbi:MAG: histidinol-phosphate aminotransferase, partial [Cyanobacteriota bacterium]|nr:histidinol-phosphate aminotransferase [Cyanobacteriota bacterium]